VRRARAKVPLDQALSRALIGAMFGILSKNRIYRRGAESGKRSSYAAVERTITINSPGGWEEGGGRAAEDGRHAIPIASEYRAMR